MSQFYARYVPTSTKNGTISTQSTDLKRSSTSKSSQPTKKRKLEEANHEKDVVASNGTLESIQSETKINGDTSKKKKQKKKQKKKKKKLKLKHSTIDGEIKTTSAKERKRKSTGKSAKNGENVADTQEVAEDETRLRHSAVFSRLTKSREIAQRRSENDKLARKPDSQDVDQNVHPDRVVNMDLGPIPQPQNPDPMTKPPQYSTVPAWVQDPIRVDEGLQKTFKELGIKKKLCENLKTQGKITALPVQSCVMPLLLDKEVETRNDICVAAATGSGKTFAYVLPILQSLRKGPKATLRAVVVVPTRALVKQVLETFETCSAGFDVQLGSMEGSKTLGDERRQLIVERMIYDPDEYLRQKESPVDWSTFSLEEMLEQVQTNQSLANIGYISEHQSKIDILVATPGRLIEHLQSTRGFNLDHVQWFVADEADRLLNESYHDWLDVVLPALKSQRATEKRDTLLRKMRLNVPKRRVTKILLSATMMNDISQLMSLELRDPRLVLMERSVSKEKEALGETDTSNSNAEFTLPLHLQESAVALKDSENKPLYLLELLNQHIFKDAISPLKLALRPAAQTRTTTANGTKNVSISSDSSDTSSNTESNSTNSSSSSSASEDDSSDASSDDSDTSEQSSSTSSDSSLTTKNSISNTSPQQTSVPRNTKRPSMPTPPRALIFTKSTESAHRLARLLSLLSPSLEPLIATLTRSTSQLSNLTSTQGPDSSKPTKAQRRTFRKTLSSFISGDIRILISTDLSSRGLDIPNLEHVVNYDVPASALTYVHRVGRTARAGQAGNAWTLVEHKQGKWFWETIAGKGKVEEGTKRQIGRLGKVGRVDVKIADEWKERYEAALKQLGEDVAGR